MGVVNIQGIGAVQIAGDTPNESELEAFQKFIAVRKEDELLDPEADAQADSFLKSPSFGRILTEVGFAIGGSILTGGLALPALGARVGLLARPFLKQLAKASAGSAAGGGVGAAVSQTFDPKEDVVKEITRAAMEGALGEAIGAPLVIKGGQVMGKMLGTSNPKKYSSLLDGAEQAEIMLQGKSVEILKGISAKTFVKMPHEKQITILREIQKRGYKPDLEVVQEFAKKRNITDPKKIQQLTDTAVEMAKGLTPGVKASNRTLEIIENIAQKSLIGGGGITRRYAAAKDIGDIVAEDLLKQFKITADSADLGRLFFESLGGARQNFLKTKDKMYARVDELIKADSKFSTNIIPMNTLRQTLDDITKQYSQGGGGDILKQINKSKALIDNQDQLYSFTELSKMRSTYSNLANELKFSGKASQATDARKIVEAIDEIFKNPSMKNLLKSSGDDAFKLLKEANDFYEAGQNVFNRGIMANLLKSAASDGTLMGKDAMAVQQVFQKLASGDKFAASKQVFREIDALTGKTVPKDGTFKELTPIFDPLVYQQTGKKVPMLTLKQAEELKEAFRGQYLSNALQASAKGEAQFGKFFDAGKFSREINKGEGKLRQFLFSGKNKGKLLELENVLQFAQGDLSRLPGIPGGIFIQLKQAGAAGNILTLGGQIGTTGLAGATLGLAPAVSILVAPAIASKLLLNPKMSNLLFKETTKLVVKGENTPSKMSALYRQILGRMVSDGLIDDQEYEQAVQGIDKFQQGYNQGLTQEQKIQDTENIVDQSGIPLPNFNPTNFPVISAGAGGAGAQGAIAGNAGAANAVAGNDPLLQGIATNRMRSGGIVDAKKVNS